MNTLKGYFTNVGGVCNFGQTPRPNTKSSTGNGVQKKPRKQLVKRAAEVGSSEAMDVRSNKAKQTSEVVKRRWENKKGII